MVYIGHKQVFARIVSGLEANGTTIDVGIALYQVAAVGVHAVGLVEMLKQVIVYTACRLLNTQ